MHRTTLARALRAAGLTALAATAFAPNAAAAAPTAALFKTLAVGTQDGVESDTLDASGAITYFAGDDGVHGLELWRTDDSAAGAQMVMDINPGTDDANADRRDGRVNSSTDGSRISDLTTVGGKTYFSATDGVHGQEPWVTEGTPESTHMLADLTAGGGSSYPGQFREVDGDVYFRSADSGEIFVLPAGGSTPQPVAGLRAQTSTPPVASTAAFYSVYGTVLSATQGTTATAVSHDFGTVGAPDVQPLLFVAGDRYTTSAVATSGNRAFLAAHTSPTDTESAVVLWVTEGHAATEVRLPGDQPASSPQWMTATTSGSIVFASGGKLYETDGTTTKEVGSTTPDVVDQTAYASGKLYLRATVRGFSYGSLQVNDLAGRGGGTATPTREVIDFRPNSEGDYVQQLVVSDDRLYVTAYTENGGTELFTTDGSAAGTVSLLPTDQGTGEGVGGEGVDLVAAKRGGGVAFVGDSVDYGRELFTTGAAPGSTRLVRDVKAIGRDGRIDGGKTLTIGANTLFQASDASGDTQPWITDGTPAGTTAMFDLTGYQYLYDLTAYGNQAAFVQRDENGRQALWLTNGTKGNRTQLSNSDPDGIVGNDVLDVKVIGNELYYRAANGMGNDGYSLFKSDGTHAGTAVPLPDSADPASTVEGWAVAGRSVYFTLRTTMSYPYHYSQWRLDTQTGTSTRLPADFGDDTIRQTFGEALAVGDQLYFGGHTDAAGLEPWVTDGTTDGTRMLADVVPGTADSVQWNNFYRAGTTVFISTYDRNTNRSTLSRLTGDTLTPVAGQEATPGTRGMQVVDGNLYLSTATQLLKIDPQGATTALGNFTDWPDFPYAHHGTLYFGAADAEHGYELWSSDGTAAGTTLAADINPGPGSSYPYGFFSAGDKLLFGATNGPSGTQLFGFYDHSDAVIAPPVTGVPAPKPPAPTDLRAVPAKLTLVIGNKADRNAPYRYTLKGTFVSAQGLPSQANCRGQARITVTRKTKHGAVKTVATYKTNLRWVKGTCVYSKSITLRKQGLKRAGTVKATVSFTGSKAQRPKQSRSVTLHYGRR